MTQLESRLSRACSELGLRIVSRPIVALPSGKRISAEALISELGAPNGMLVLLAYASVADSLEELRREGYGFSVLSEPRPEAPFEIGSYVEMFSDWGWSGPAAGRPKWMLE